VVDQAGVAALARRQPLTVSGDEIGSFDIMVACGRGSDSYDMSYRERRYDGDSARLPAELDAVTVAIGGKSASLKVVASDRRSKPDELITYAAGPVPAALIRAFGAAGNHSMTVETRSRGLVTGIRLGNTGVQQSLPRFAAGCTREIGDRADLPVRKTGGIAAAK
jgi:hypothetical protein